jgi:hypothetical protein
VGSWEWNIYENEIVRTINQVGQQSFGGLKREDKDLKKGYFDVG